MFLFSKNSKKFTAPSICSACIVFDQKVKLFVRKNKLFESKNLLIWWYVLFHLLLFTDCIVVVVLVVVCVCFFVCFRAASFCC